MLAVNGIDIVWEFEGGPIGYQIKGHVDKAAFVEAVERERHARIEIADVHHCYVRNVPVGRDRPGETILVECKPGRGAYAITWTRTLGF